MSTFPNIGFPLREGHSRAPMRRGVRFETDAGAKQRRLTTGNRFKETYSWRLATPARDSFWAFYRANPTAWFNFTDPLTGTVLQARFLVGSEPSETPRGIRWIVTATLEVRR